MSADRGLIVRIPDLLSVMAFRICVRIKESRAVHVTEETAQELLLLAELKWEEENACRAVRSTQAGGGGGLLAALTPTDLQMWWLICAKDLAHCDEESSWIRVFNPQRAAVCAELALLAETEGAGISARPVTGVREECFRRGTKEGARAVLEFVIREMSGCVGIAQERPWCVKLLLTYRRELEVFQ